MKRDDETMMEYVRRAVSWLDHNNEGCLGELPTVHSIFELFDLISDTYDVSLLDEVYAEIVEGNADAQPMEDFINKYDLTWNMPWKEEANGEAAA